MNNKTRTQLRKISKEMDALLAKIEDLKTDLESIQEEEQDKYDNMPEQLQDTDNGCRMYEGIEQLEDLVSRLDSLVSELEDVSNDVIAVTEI